MSSNSLKLGLLLGLQLNHYSKDCPCQHCKYSCHHYRLSHVRVIREYDITDKVCYFQVDNVGNNDTCIKAILKKISSSSTVNQWRLRYYKYVINLVIKVFLFSNDPDVFKLEINTLEKFKFEIRHKRELLIL